MKNASYESDSIMLCCWFLMKTILFMYLNQCLQKSTAQKLTEMSSYSPQILTDDEQEFCTEFLLWWQPYGNRAFFSWFQVNNKKNIKSSEAWWLELLHDVSWVVRGTGWLGRGMIMAPMIELIIAMIQITTILPEPVICKIQDFWWKVCLYILSHVTHNQQ